MLSQRLALLSERISQPNQRPSRLAALRATLAYCSNLMARSHIALESRDATQMRALIEAGGPCLSRPNEARIEQPLEPVEKPLPPELQQFLATAEALADRGLSERARTNLTNLSEASIGKLLLNLDSATLKAQEDSTRQLRTLLTYNWLLILVLVLLEVFLIFRPMTRAVESSVAELERTNRRLKNNENRLSDFARTAAHQLWETNEDFQVTWTGPSDPQAKLCADSLSIGHPLWELKDTSATEAEADWSALRAKLDDRLAFTNFEYSTLTVEGEKRWWRAHGRPVYNAKGEFSGYRGTTQKITTEREAEEYTRRSERFRALGQLTAGVAHDFNNILSVVLGNAELSLMRKEDRDWKQSAAAIIKASERGSALTNQLLAYGRAQRLKKEPVDVAQFLTALETVLSRTLGEDFALHIELPDEPLTALTDRHLLEDASINLAINALDACGAGGTLVIRVNSEQEHDRERDRDPEALCSEFVCITFEDNGCGFSSDERDKIFDPFYTTKSGGGSGLGLSMVHGFVHQSGGFLNVESNPGQGASFKLYLPRTYEQGTAPVSAPRPITTPGRGEHLLLVEDNEMVRGIMKRHLERLGFSVHAANDGTSALELLSFMEFDVLVLDVVLPGNLDGVDVYWQALEKSPEAQVLFCSGFTGIDQEKSKDVPGRMLRKPFTIDQLPRALTDLLSEQNGKANVPSVV